MDQPPYWQHSISRHGGRCTIALAGELDSAAAPAVRAILTDQVCTAQVTAVEVDLAGATFIDSSMLTALILGYRLAEEHGRTFVLVNPSAATRRVLGITGLLELMGAGVPESLPGSP